MTKPLTPKQQRFVAEYLVDLNATQAAIRAGYSERTAKQQGSRLLTNADVQNFLAEAMTAKCEKVEITTDLVLQGLLAEAQLTGEGSTHSARVAAWAKLGEYLKLFVQKHEHDHSGEVFHRVEKMTESEREERARALLTKGARLLPKPANAA